MEWLHDRMPLIFEEGISNTWSRMKLGVANCLGVGDPKMDQWLDPSIGWTKEIEGLLGPFHDSLTIYQGKYPRLPPYQYDNLNKFCSSKRSG